MNHHCTDKSNLAKQTLSDLFTPTNSGIEEKDFAETLISDLFRPVDSNNGVRLQLPIANDQTLDPLTMEPQMLDPEGSEEQQMDPEALTSETWQKLISLKKQGSIPLLISLLEQPNEDAVVQLKANHPSIDLSAELTFTAESWCQPKLIWLDLSNISPEESGTTLQIDISLEAADGSGDAEVDTVMIKIPKLQPCKSEDCGTPPTQAKEIVSNEPNLDLELSTVIEEKSTIYLLLKTSLSPFLLLTNIALDSIRQIQAAINTTTTKAHSKAALPPPQYPEADKALDQNHGLINTATFLENANKSPTINELLLSAPTDPAFGSADITIPVEIF